MKIKTIFFSILIVLASVLASVCCSFYVPVKLTAPLIMHSAENKIISWNAVDNADKYEIFVHDQLCKTINQEDESTIFSYGTEFDADGMYIVKVRAVGDGRRYTESNFTETVTIVVGEQCEITETSTTQYDIVNTDTKSPQNLISLDNVLTWKMIENVQKYIIGIFTNETGIKYYSSTTNYVDLNAFAVENEVLYVRIGAVYEGDDNLYLSDSTLYSPLEKNSFSERYFIFDGGVYDYYIEDYAELQALYYHAFIDRLEDYTFIVAESFSDEFLNNYYDSDLISDCFMETYGYENVPAISKIHPDSELLTGLTENGYRVKCTFFYGEKQPYIIGDRSASIPTRVQNTNSTPYYEFVDYAERSENYEFKSDDNFLYDTISTSEQLYWAVQSGISPRFESTTCRAYLIYEKAKNVLNEIIEEGMTDYEKVVSIFDWITVNTTYDYNAYEECKGTNTNPMQYACYYLEGVFLDEYGLAVCDGYSKAFSLMCNMEGIDCARISGYAVTNFSYGGHAWNKVKLDGKWYMVDITWAERGDSENMTETLSHYYFLIDHRDFEESHIEGEVRQDVYDTYTDGGYYSYYKNTKFEYDGETYDLYIENDTELNALLNYCGENQIKGLDVMFSIYYIPSASKLSECLLAQKPTYQTLTIEHGDTVFPYTALENGSTRELKYGFIVNFEMGYMIKNNTTLNDFAKVLVENNITSCERISICIDESFLQSLNTYDAGLTLAQNIEKAFNNNVYFESAGKVIKLKLLKANLSSEYNTAEGVITINYNHYSAKITDK